MLKICFIGLGSIGIRHIRNLTLLLGNKTAYQIDAVRMTKRVLPEDVISLITNSYTDLAEMPCDYDIVFITNPTTFHYDTIKRVSGKTKHMFIEKPVFQNYKETFAELELKPESIYYVACPLRYGSVVSALKDRIKNERIYSVRAISSSYLPDWRKNIDYRENYSAHESMGGGVARDIIHEIDYLTYLFGMPDTGCYFGGTYSDLEIDSDDLGAYILKYSDKLIELHLDYFGRKTVRKIEIYCPDYMIEGDLVENTLRYIYSDHVEDIALAPDQDFRNEMKNFLSMVAGKAENENDIYHANEVLKLALGGF